MKTEIIEQYIKFAIENWFNFKIFYQNEEYNQVAMFYVGWEIGITNEIIDWVNIQQLITSKPFIEAVVRGLLEKQHFEFSKEEVLLYWTLKEYTSNIGKTIIYDEITRLQALAIRDDTLEDFITNLRIWKS